MKFNLIEKQIESTSISTGRFAAADDVSGCDSLAYVMVVTAASTPGTASIQLQGSLDQTTWVSDGSPTSVTVNGTYTALKDRPQYRFYRIQYIIASGSYTSTLRLLAKGDKG